MMKLSTFKYLLKTFQHKYYVLLAGIKCKANLFDLIIHDWTKLTHLEAPYYGRQFFGDKKDPGGFAIAWLNHQNTHKHHWEYWVPRTKHMWIKDHESEDAIDMPERYVREMVADWMGASRAYDNTWPDKKHWFWLHKNFWKINITKKTRELLIKVLTEQGFTLP